MLTRVVALVALTGCDLIFQLNDPPVVDAPGDAGVAPRCSSTNMLGEDFDGVNTWAWRHDGALSGVGSVAIVDSALQVELDGPGTSVADIVPYLDLREDSISVEIVRSIDQGSVDLALLSESAPTNALAVNLTGDQLSFLHGTFGNTNPNVAGKVTYDPVAHRFWRIARTGDTTTWSTSADGVAYHTEGMASDQPWATFMRPLIIGSQGASAPPFNIRLSTVNNGPGDVRATACKASTLTDEFDGVAIADHWGRRRQDFLLSQQGGVFKAALVGNFNETSIGSSTVYDLTDSSIALKVEAVTAGLDKETFLVIERVDQTPIARFAVAQGVMRATLDGDPVDDIPYSNALHKFWRLRHAGGSLFWETSETGDDNDYQMFASRLVTGLDRVMIRIGAIGSASGADDEAIFDRFN